MILRWVHANKQFISSLVLTDRYYYRFEACMAYVTLLLTNAHQYS